MPREKTPAELVEEELRKLSLPINSTWNEVTSRYVDLQSINRPERINHRDLSYAYDFLHMWIDPRGNPERYPDPRLEDPNSAYSQRVRIDEGAAALSRERHRAQAEQEEAENCERHRAEIQREEAANRERQRVRAEEEWRERERQRIEAAAREREHQRAQAEELAQERGRQSNRAERRAMRHQRQRARAEWTTTNHGRQFTEAVGAEVGFLQRMNTTLPPAYPQYQILVLPPGSQVNVYLPPNEPATDTNPPPYRTVDPNPPFQIREIADEHSN